MLPSKDVAHDVRPESRKELGQRVPPSDPVIAGSSLGGPGWSSFHGDETIGDHDAVSHFNDQQRAYRQYFERQT